MSLIRERVLEKTIDLMERGLVPDRITRFGMSRLCAERLHAYARQTADQRRADQRRYIEDLRRAPLAVHTADANRQHYEVPSAFFGLVLGEHRKYSCAFWDTDTRTLDEAEKRALEITMERADLANGQSILELGCGWGSLTLAMAAKFPQAKITAVSNSNSQRQYIEGEAAERGLKNVRVVTRDVSAVENLKSEFGVFDRVVSVEMFEHLRNYALLFERIAACLAPGGKLFTHIFTHREHAYLFETEGEDNWMGRYFFTGGQMPSSELFSSFQNHLRLAQQWTWDGTHYAKTADAWLANQDRRKAEIMPVLTATYGAAEAERWFNRWRMFFLACSELFGFAGGREWFVSHYLFERQS